MAEITIERKERRLERATLNADSSVGEANKTLSEEATASTLVDNALIKERYKRLISGSYKSTTDVFEEKEKEEQLVTPIFNQKINFYGVIDRASVEAPAQPAAKVSEPSGYVQRKENAMATQFKEYEPILSDTRVSCAEDFMPSLTTIQYSEKTYKEDASKEKNYKYALSKMGKIAIAIYAVLVVTIFALIVVNTRLIDRLNGEVGGLQTQTTQLTRQADELETQLSSASSYDAITEYANANGMVKD